MKYFSIAVGQRGTANSLHVIEHDLVDPAPGLVRVKVLYTGVSFGGLLRQNMACRTNPQKPLVLGYEVVGVVDTIGDGVSQFHEGEQVVAFTGGTGGYTQYTYRTPDELFHLPAAADPIAAVPVVLNYMTAYQCLHRIGRTAQGATAVITGASGGVGTALLDLGQLHHLSMYATASKPKHPLLTEKGAVPIDYTREDVVEVVRAAEPQGVDVVLDSVGGPGLAAYLKVLKPGGRIVSYGIRSVANSKRFNFLPLVWGYAKLYGQSVFSRGKHVSGYEISSYKRRHQQEFREDMQVLLNWLAENKIKPIVHAVVPLRDAQQAHELLMSGTATGKIVLDCWG